MSPHGACLPSCRTSNQRCPRQQRPPALPLWVRHSVHIITLPTRVLVKRGRAYPEDLLLSLKVTDNSGLRNLFFSPTIHPERGLEHQWTDRNLGSGKCTLQNVYDDRPLFSGAYLGGPNQRDSTLDAHLHARRYPNITMWKECC